MVNFTRASTATYVDVGGVLQTAADNEPRFEGKGILIEGASTNIAPNSISTGKVDGLALNGLTSGNVTENVPSVDGANNALRLESESAGSGFYLGGVVPDAVSVTISVWLRLVSGDSRLTVGVDSDNKIVEMTDKWTRFSHTTKGEAGSGRSAIFYSKGVSVWEVSFCQVELLSFATSYIPTNGTPITRAADSLSLSKGTIEMNSSDISIFVDAVSYRKENSSYAHWIYAGSSTPVESGYKGKILYAKYGVDPDVLVKEDVNEAKKGITYNRGSKTLKAYSGNNVSSHDYSSLPNDIGSVFIGGTAHKWFGHIKNFRVWNKVLTTNQISFL